MNCPTCRKLVAINAYNCPNCGHKFRSTPVNIVSKIILGVLCLIIISLVIRVALVGVNEDVNSIKRTELTVPNIVGKDFIESERELNQIGLVIKKRALRLSNDKPNTILEQSPKAGEQALKGQQVLVVISISNLEEIPK